MRVEVDIPHSGLILKLRDPRFKISQEVALLGTPPTLVTSPVEK